MKATTTVGRGQIKVFADYEVDRDGEMYINDITDEVGAEVSGAISDKDFDYVKNACWNAYDRHCASVNADAAISKFESAHA